MVDVNIVNVPIGEIVANDFRTAEIFKNAGIDFCCGGKMSLGEACREKNVDSRKLINEINEIELLPLNQATNYKEWDLGFLCDYIVNTHHKYVIKTLPELTYYTQKIALVHGARHTELNEVYTLFTNINMELQQHLNKEENVLFPAIKEMLRNNSRDAKNVIESEIARMTGEHEFAGGAMDKINEITGGYKVPEDGCNTYQVTFKLLQQFEDDLHIHVHLENNILFPKALKLAQ
jgi:regulator of cell morphogenesis and NO signaling